MKPRHLTALAVILLCAITTFAQKEKFALMLKQGAIVPKANISSTTIDSFNTKASRFGNKLFAVLQFTELPSEDDKKLLAASGIQLLNYIPNNAYTVTISGRADIGLLQRLKARALFSLSPQQKMQASLSNGIIPSWAQTISGTADVWITYPKTFSTAEVIASLKTLNVDVLSTEYSPYRILAIRLAANRLMELAALPFVEYVQPVPPKSQPLNYNSRRGSRANVLNASAANGGKGLNGEGVVIGVGDIGEVNHVDLNAREIKRSPAQDVGHATHVHGIAAGAGIINELYRGYASKATIISQSFTNILSYAPVYVQDYGMIATNNSYGNGFDCNYNGTYDLYSAMLDQQAFDLPNLQHVFAAGNSGNYPCAPYPTGFRTVFGSFQSAKNVICVGNADDQGNLFYSSSKGPVKDGRIKPDVVADGTAVVSTYPGNNYATDWGTSMSAPAVTGSLALLYQRYRQLHSNANPKSALMKALICNGADDKGNSGPDYSFGFGNLNLLRSIDMLEQNHYFLGNSKNGSADVQSITVPANTSQLKVMLYWHDPAASLLSSQTLVNDLDLEVVDPATNTILPQKLDTAASNVTKVATTGADHINNMEQVIIDNPSAGNYTIRVKGTAIAQNPSQEYVVVYDPIPVSLQLTYPVGGEGLAPGEYTKISWDAYGGPDNTFTLQYSTDNGASWNDINTTVDAGSRFYTWQVPATTTNKAIVRVLKNGTALSSTSNAFTIVGIPSVALSSTQCEGYIAINWNAIADATDYEVMMMRGDEMVAVGTTTSTSYTFNSLSKDSTYWVTVRARANGKSGRRASAISRQPNDGNCSGSISDNDLKLNAILAPLSGRKFTSTELSAASPIKVQIKNLDDAPANNFTVQYSVNGGSWVTENVAATIDAGGIYNYTFTAAPNLSAVGNYTLVAVVKNNNADAVTANDTLTTVIKQLDNQPLNLASPFLDNLENALPATYLNDTIGLAGIDRYDFENSNSGGRLRTYVNTGIAYSGSKSLVLDKDGFSASNSVNYVTGTFNLSNYNANANDLRFNFQYNFEGQKTDTANKVWIRGNDTAPWIEVYDFSSTNINSSSGTYSVTRNIEIADSLLSNGQNFSSSFQIRWGQNATAPGSDPYHIYSIDDIHIYEVSNDMEMVSIDAPANLSCGLNTSEQIKVTLKNSSHATLTNVPVKYSINGGPWVTETISSIAARTTLPYTFSHSLDLSAQTTYTIKVLVDYPDDNYRLNDTLTTTLRNSALITSFPYLQNFEANNGGWYTDGYNSSWEYGTPASNKINHAASGAKAWKTRLTGNYNDLEYSYLYSPCFDISGMAKPTLSFSLALDLEDCGTALCDAAWVEYSADGKTWQALTDTLNAGTNWYNAQGKVLWSVSDYTRWHIATMTLPQNVSRLHLRFVLMSDPAVNREGVGVDDIHIYDNTKGIYDGITLSSAISQNITGGTNWVDFESGGKLVASIQPNNQNMGITNVQAYINTGAVRDTVNQYFHDRNITIKPTKRSLQDSVTVRFYFLDAETENLINAKSCATCNKPASAYDLGVPQYTHADTTAENGTINDNSNGVWWFINPNKVAKVPFDKGYYAEFKVKDFSEFWLSKGALSSGTPLPVVLVDFLAQKSSANNVLVKWNVANEIAIDHYEVELVKGGQSPVPANFTTIGSVASNGNSTTAQQYSFTDEEAFKTGTRYYRLKIIGKDGSVKYSQVQSVAFADNITWRVYPNPSTGFFQLVYQLNAGTVMMVKLTDATGRTIQQLKLIGDGNVQKQAVDISGKQYAAGVYLLQTLGAGQKSFKLYKQ